MPKIKANNISMHYEQQGTGEPLILIPYLAADHACYAFQVAEYAKHFTCISVDLRGTGESDNPDSPYSTEVLADDIAAFLQAKQIEKAHISGLSLGAAVGMWLAAKYPDKVKSLSLHSAWPSRYRRSCRSRTRCLRTTSRANWAGSRRRRRSPSDGATSRPRRFLTRAR